jgi:hypothetical protein
MQVVADRSVVVGREPPAEHRRVGALGEVVGGSGEHVAAPGVGEVCRALGDVGVAGDVDLDVDEVDQLLEVFTGEVDRVGVGGVDVGDALAQQRQRDALAVVVEDRRDALEALVPDHVPAALVDLGGSMMSAR